MTQPQERAAESTRLGSNYWKLWASSAVSTLGDGIYLTALLLLGASLTSDPVRLSTISIAATLPWLLFAILGGVLVDRMDRRRVMWVTDAIRFAIVAVLAVLVAAERADIWLLAAVSFLLATGEVVYGNAAQSIVPQIVSQAPERLQRANSRLVSARIVLRDFVGRPLGGAVFGVVAWLPIALNAASFGLAAHLIAKVDARPATTARRRGLLAEIRDGMRWLWRHRLLRTLALAVCADNFAFVLWNAVLVLMLQQRFQLGGLGFGILTACLGIGGVLGSLGVARISRRVGMAATMIGAMLLEGAATAALGLAQHRILAGVTLFAIGASAVGWNVITVSLRQSIVPEELQGRVNGAYQLLAVAGAPAGAALGGVVGRWQGLAAPFLLGAATIFVVTAIVATVIRRSAIDAAQAATESTGQLR